MRSPPSRSRSLVIGVVTSVLLGACSLLALSDEEAMRGNNALADGGQSSSDAPDDDKAANPTSDSGSDGSALKACGSVQGCYACNDDVCSGCALNGTPCSDSNRCCSGACAVQGDSGTKRCGASSCVGADSPCTLSSGCCAGLTCIPAPVGGGKKCGACLKAGGRCSSDADCCTGRCTAQDGGSFCIACGATGASCSVDDECCSSECPHKAPCK